MNTILSRALLRQVDRFISFVRYLRSLHAEALAFALLACIVAVMALSACATSPPASSTTTSGTTTTPTITAAQVQQAASDASTVISGISAVLPTLETALGAGTNASTQLAKDFGAAQTAATALQSATTNTAQSGVQTFEGAINAVLAGVGSLNLSGTAGQVVSAATVLVPVIEGAVNLVSAAAPAPGQLTPDQARAVLLLAAKGGGQ